MKRLLTITLAGFLLAACQQGGSGSSGVSGEAGISGPSGISGSSGTSGSSGISGSSGSSGSPEEPASFQTMGTVIAARFADVKFEASLPVLRVLVRNGDRVRQGQLLAELNAYKQTNAIEQCQKEIAQARLQMQDVVISQGYDPEQMERMPQKVRQIAEVKSGLLLAQSRLAAAEHELKATRVVAPFDGVVANVTARASQLAQVGETVCRIISPQQMDVEFRVISASQLFDGMHVSVNLIEQQP